MHLYVVLIHLQPLIQIAARIKENWTVRQQNRHGFASISCDQSIKQAIDRDCKAKGRLVGFALNTSAVHKWILAQAERAAILRNCEEMAGVSGGER